MRGELKTGLIVVAVIIAVIVIGTVGYTLIEGWSLLDSLFMTVTTIFTVGFEEVHPLSRAGEVFTHSAHHRRRGHHPLRHRADGGVCYRWATDRGVPQKGGETAGG